MSTPVRLRSFGIAALAALAGSSLALGAGPATRPGAVPTSRPVRLRDMLPPDLPVERDDPPTDAEWADISKFCNDNMPNRWSLFQKVRQQRGDDAPLVVRLKGRLAGRYRQLQELVSTNHPYADRALQQVRLEDTVWGAAVDARQDPNDVKKVAALREATKNLFDATLDMRSEWLNMLADALQLEQKELDEENNRRDAMIDKQVDQLLHDGAIDPGGLRGFGIPRGRNWGPMQRGLMRRFPWEGGRPTTRPEDGPSSPGQDSSPPTPPPQGGA